MWLCGEVQWCGVWWVARLTDPAVASCMVTRPSTVGSKVLGIKRGLEIVEVRRGLKGRKEADVGGFFF